MFSSSLLGDAHQYLAHFCLASCWVFASGLHVHLEQLIWTLRVSSWVLQLGSVEVIQERLYATNFVKLLDRFIILTLIYQAERPEDGCFLVVLDHPLQDSLQACLFSLLLNGFLHLRDLHLKLVQLLQDTLHVGLLLFFLLSAWYRLAQFLYFEESLRQRLLFVDELLHYLAAAWLAVLLSLVLEILFVFNAHGVDELSLGINTHWCPYGILIVAWELLWLIPEFLSSLTS